MRRTFRIFRREPKVNAQIFSSLEEVFQRIENECFI